MVPRTTKTTADFVFTTNKSVLLLLSFRYLYNFVGLRGSGTFWPKKQINEHKPINIKLMHVEILYPQACNKNRKKNDTGSLY